MPIGTLTAKKIWNAKTTGNLTLKASIDNVEYVGFGKSAAAAVNLTVGQEVEYTSAPGDKEGDTPRIVFIKARGSSPANTTTTTTPTPSTTTPTTTPTYSSTKKDDSILWQVAYKLAVELYAGLSTPTLPEARAVQLLARDLRQRMAQDIEGVKDTDPTITENP